MSEQSLNIAKRFFVYVYLDPRKPGHFKYDKFEFNYEPLYAGKGTNSRDSDHLILAYRDSTNCYFYNKLRKIIKTFGKPPIIVRIKNDLEELESFKLEKYVIKTIGRLDLKKGPLVNKTDGGDGVYNLSKETRHIIAMKNWSNPKYREKQIDRWRNNWKIISPNNSEVIIRDLSQWCKENNFTYSTCKAASKKRIIYKGYCFINLDKDKNLTKNDFRHFKQYSERKYGELFEIIYNDQTKEIIRSLRKFIIKNKFSISGIRNALNNGTSYNNVFYIRKSNVLNEQRFKFEHPSITEFKQFLNNSLTSVQARSLLPKVLIYYRNGFFQNARIIDKKIRILKTELQQMIDLLQEYKPVTEVLKQFKIHNFKLHHWERSGLIQPKIINNVRFYPIDQIPKIQELSNKYSNRRVNIIY